MTQTLITKMKTMKHILIFILFSLSFVLFGQNDTHPNFTQSQLDSALNGTKQVEIPSHFNSNGDKNTWDIDLKDLSDVINGKSTPSQIIALQDTTGCTSWTSASTNFQVDMPTADSLLFITINGTNYTINLPMDDGSTGSIPPATAALMQTAIGNAITSAGYSATTSVGASGIFTNITYQLTAGNSPLTIQYTIKTGGFYNNLVIAKSVPYNCTYTNRPIKATDTQLAVNTCPAITLAYSEGNLDTLRVYDCNTNDWRIVGAEHDYNYSLSPLIVGVDTTGFILNKNGIAKDTVLLPSPTVDTDIKLLFSVVNDSIRIDSFNYVLGVIVGTPQYIDNVINKPDLVQSAANDLRVSGTTIVRGSDDPANAKGSEFTSDIYNHMAGFDDSWIGAYGSARPIQKIFNNGTIEFSTNGNHATELSMHYTQGAMAIGQGNVYYYPYTFIIGRNNLVTNDYNLVNGLFSTINSSGVLSSGAYNETSAGSSYVTLSGILQKALGASPTSFSSGQGNTMTDSKSSFSTGELHDNTGDFQFTQGYDQRNNTYNGILLGYGNHYSWTGQSKASWVNTDYHVRLNRGTAANPNAAQSSLVILKNGFTQINTDLNSNSSHTQSQVTPVSALDVVSTTAGFQAPRMTEAELNTYLSTFNLTTDITGGANGVAYCKIGMEVICTDCTALDGSTTGVKVNLYPNAAQTAWIAKKSH